MARILIADDDAHIARVMGLWLQRHGHDVVSVGNGAEALSVIESGAVDLLVSDMNMPVMDGVELAITLRERGRNDLPIVMLTARCDQNVLAERMTAYHVTVYPKPFVPSKLVEDVNRLLRLNVVPNVVATQEVPCPLPK